MKKLLIPSALFIHISAILIYMRFSEINSAYWDIYYFLIDPIVIVLIISAILVGRCSGEYDPQFLFVLLLFNALRGICYAGNYLHLINRTFNFEIISLGTAIVTVMIIISGVRHGHFKI